jgi:hypothetical protein
VTSPVSAYRISRSSRGAFDPVPRSGGEDVTGWSRYDTIERTLYASDDKLTAYMELLAPYRTEIASKRRALQPVADFMGVPLSDLWRDIVAEWEEAGDMATKWLPRAFREGRAMYTLSFPIGSWIDITATETLAAMPELFGDRWLTADGELTDPLTLSHLTGDDRVLTTAIAAALRERIELDDGTLPLGIRFLSKHGRPSSGTGLCWAYWMREVDHGLDEPSVVTAVEPIAENDEVFKAAQAHCKIRSR